METVNYDAVVLDLGLPDKDGLDVLKKWRDDGSVTPVLILTACDAVEDRVKGLNAGSDDYMLKPLPWKSCWPVSGLCCVVRAVCLALC